MPKKSKTNNLTALILRLGLAFVFLYAAIESLRSPLVWSFYLPNFLTKSISATLLIRIFAIYEIGLAAWLLIGKKVQYAALLSAITLIAIVITNPGQLMTTFRDIGLALMAVALFYSEK